VLFDISTQTSQLLPVYNLKSGEVRRTSDRPVSGSVNFDVWEGEYLGKQKVAIKSLRGTDFDEKKYERLVREIRIWRAIWDKDRGKHFVPFLGIYFDNGQYPCLVSPWMGNGDALTYVRKHPNCDRKRLIRRIAEGIHLLHTYNPPIVHGDIKGANVLIDYDFKPLLADFGLSKIMENITQVPFSQTQGVSDSYRWFAPELCSAPGILSKESDMFSYGMMVLELMTGNPPFSSIKRVTEVLLTIQRGERPARPLDPDIVVRGLDDRLWDLLTRCWKADPAERPTIEEVLRELP